MDIGVMGYERVVKARLGERGLTAIIAVHDTTLGPSLGGTRMWPFSSEEEALRDVLSLSRNMTFKAAMAGLKLGGGKSVIIGDPKKDKSEKLFSDFGALVESLEGRYIASEDVGTEVADIEIAGKVTKHVVGTDPAKGGSGDPSPMTALGVFHGMRACLETVFGSEIFKGRRIAVQGAGKVGSYLAKRLVEAGAEVVISDVDSEKLQALQKELAIEICSPGEIHEQSCDVFSPCALGGLLNDETIAKLKCRVIAGGANNQLEHHRLAETLDKLGILYVPDYVINAGGLINVAAELGGYVRREVEEKVIELYLRVAHVLKIARESGVTPLEAANRMAQEILRKK